MKKFTFAGLLAASIMGLASCNGLTPDSVELLEGDVVVTLSKTLIQADGQDFATVTVTVGGEEVTENFTLYNGDDEVLDLGESMTFTTDEPGIYGFWASYGTKYSEVVELRAVGVTIPDAPADPQPESTDFHRNVMLIQFTGTGCGYCPPMTTSIANAMEDETIAAHTVLTAVHTYNGGDPAYIDTTLPRAMGVSRYPTLVGDMYVSSNYYNANTAASVYQNCMNREEAKAGISVSANSDGLSVVALATVKAAVSGEFRVGAWLLEDGIQGRQSDYKNLPGDFNTHNNCVRYIDSKVSNSNYFGYSLGTLEAGETADYLFTIELDESWVKDNLHLVVFVCTTTSSGSWAVNNAIDCGLNDVVPFDYSE